MQSESVRATFREVSGERHSNWIHHPPSIRRYFHNIKKVARDYFAMHVDEERVNNATFAKELSHAGYAVGMFGKYMTARMQKDVPPGFDVWFSNGGGNYMAPIFQTKNVAGLLPGLTNRPTSIRT
jgi:hypothetical protein